MQLTARALKRVNIFTCHDEDSGYVGKKSVPDPIGFVYAEVFPEAEKLGSERSGRRTDSGTTLILRSCAGVRCGDLAGIYGCAPDSRIIEVRRYPHHLTVRTERL